MVKLFSKNSNLCDHNPPTLQTDRRKDRQTNRQTTCDRNTALCTKVHRAVKTFQTDTSNRTRLSLTHTIEYNGMKCRSKSKDHVVVDVLNVDDDAPLSGVCRARAWRHDTRKWHHSALLQTLLALTPRRTESAVRGVGSQKPAPWRMWQRTLRCRSSSFAVYWELSTSAAFPSIQTGCKQLQQLLYDAFEPISLIVHQVCVHRVFHVDVRPVQTILQRITNMSSTLPLLRDIYCILTSASIHLYHVRLSYCMLLKDLLTWSVSFAGAAVISFCVCFAVDRAITSLWQPMHCLVLLANVTAL